MDSAEIRKKFLDFFEKRGHVIIPSASLVPENDPSVLFTTAGMQQFKPYYIGLKDPQVDFGSKNTVSVQKCVRTSDIDEVGDDTHLTFFEMLGNFSFGGYWKKEAIEYAYDFITKELGLTIDYVSVFGGNSSVPRDNESSHIWKVLDSNIKIVDGNVHDNFWGPTGIGGPCGPTTEIYVNGVEIWNIVFNEFIYNGTREELLRREDKIDFEKLKTQGVDTGMGLERLLVQVQKKKNVYETDLFNGEKSKEERIIADHIKASLFMISDGIRPSNKESGYVLRKLIRTVATYKNVDLEKIIDSIINKYKESYSFDREQAVLEFNKEKEGYEVSRTTTIKVLQGRESGQITGYEAFGISSTLGTRPADLMKLATDLGVLPSPNFEKELEEASRKHQELSRAGAEGKFKGGLSGTGEMETKYHTTAHLLHQALRDTLDSTILCKGSNITPERLRFDFPFERKLTDKEKKKIEDIVNDKIQAKLPVNKVTMKKEDAEKTGALHIFNDKYPDMVNVYYIGDSLETAYSKEFCGGPHVSQTGVLGKFKIAKEEAVSAGIRRIKATLE
ncbi:MAG: alanine--tRNA ligase-related protein [Minisyncoccia bacterium]